MMDMEERIRRAAITGVGAYVPEKVVSNDDLSKLIDTNDEWIRTRTGIISRRIARADEPSSLMGLEAGRRALEAAGAKPDEIDLLVVATITPDNATPSTACRIQPALGLHNATCFDINAACSGFIFALNTARQFIATGTAKKALVIGVDKMSSLVDWNDRSTCILFGDGAGAVVLESTDSSNGILSCSTGCDGSLADMISVPAGGSAMPVDATILEKRLQFLRMDGNSVFKLAVRGMVTASAKALKDAGIEVTQLSCIVPHQANLRIIQSIADKLGLGMNRFVINLDKYGNTTAATIPLAMDEAVRDGRIKDGDYVLIVAFGSGLTWGASVIRWGR